MQQKSDLPEFSIGDISKQLGLSADTLRYYEKINLLPRVHRAPSGVRRYCQHDIVRIEFIQRAKKMKFTLAEIRVLLRAREEPQWARREVLELTLGKLDEIENYLQDLTILRDELTKFTNLCADTKNGCPIIDGIEKNKQPG